MSLSPEREDRGAGGARLGPVQANTSVGHRQEVLGRGLGTRTRILGPELAQPRSPRSSQRGLREEGSGDPGCRRVCREV